MGFLPGCRACALALAHGPARSCSLIDDIGFPQPPTELTGEQAVQLGLLSDVLVQRHAGLREQVHSATRVVEVEPHGGAVPQGTDRPLRKAQASSVVGEDVAVLVDQHQVAPTRRSALQEPPHVRVEVLRSWCSCRSASLFSSSRMSTFARTVAGLFEVGPDLRGLVERGPLDEPTRGRAHREVASSSHGLELADELVALGDGGELGDDPADVGPGLVG